MSDDLIAAKGRAIAESGKYGRPRGEYLGRIEAWGIDVYEGSRREWITALRIEYRREKSKDAQ